MIRVSIVAATAVARAGLRAMLLGAADRGEVTVVDDGSDVSVVMLEDSEEIEIDTAVPVVLLLDSDSAQAFGEGLRAGARAVLAADTTPDELLAAVQAVAAGLTVLPARQAQLLFEPRPQERVLEALTPRETEILRLLAEGISNKEIAARLAISEHTVKFHITGIMAKLGAGTRTEAVTTGLRQGLILL